MDAFDELDLMDTVCEDGMALVDGLVGNCDPACELACDGKMPGQGGMEKDLLGPISDPDPVAMDELVAEYGGLLDERPATRSADPAFEELLDP